MLFAQSTMRAYALLFCMLFVHVASAETIMVVNITKTSIPVQIAVQVCAGLFNRDTSRAGAAYPLLQEPLDSTWLADIEGIKKPQLTSIDTFLAKCLSSQNGNQPVAAGFIRYNMTSQQLFVPMFYTMAGVLDAVPLEDGSPYSKGVTKVFDAIESFANATPLSVTQYVYDHYVNQTSTMAFVDPGYSSDQKDPFAPTLKSLPNPGLVDFVVKERLFSFYMVFACVPLTPEHTLMETMVTHNPWPRPITVYGYDDTMAFGGVPLFEAETTCVKEHNLGEANNGGVNNLAFFSRASRPPITKPLVQNPPVSETLNRSRTYIGLTIGDGDNMGYLKSTRREWMLERISRCSAGPKGSDKTCFPLLWSMSPFPLRIAPDWLRWYYARAQETGRDYFVLPPSGAQYAYPSLMSDSDQANFVKDTERDATLLDTNSAVAWEFMGTWGNAIKNYFPRYDTNGIVEGFFAVNVPYMIPVLEFNTTTFYKKLGPQERVILFRPREWRGTNPSGAPPFSGKEYLTPAQLAAEINGYPAGTVSQIYLTSDGGANLSDVYDMVASLDDHVRIVDHRTLISMAQKL